MLEMNYYVIEKELLNLNEVAVRDLLITGPKGSIHIDTRNSTMIPDTYEAVENNNLGLNLNAMFETKIQQIDSNFYELIINNKMEECKMMNHETVKQLIKMGELKAILNNIDANGKIKNNCIVLAKNDCVLLRTNGAVIYGLYDATKQGNFGRRNKNLIGFTHDMIQENPYVNTTDYVTYKPLVLKAYRDIFDDKAKQKLEAVRYIIANHQWYRDQLNKVDQKQKEVIQEKIITEQSAVIEGLQYAEDDNGNATVSDKVIESKKREEVKEMNKELNVMGLAHKIRRELGLEGDYRAQMKMAMSYAWAIKKGTKTIEDILGTTEATAPTYNVANTTVEQEAAVTTEHDGVEYTLEIVEVSKGSFKMALTQLSSGAVKYTKNVITAPSLSVAYLNLANNIEKIAPGLPANTKITALPLTITACRTRQGLKDICKSKNFTYETFKVKNAFEGLVAPSGDAV